VKKGANFKAAVWFLAGMRLHWFLNQNCNLGLDWTNYKLRTNVNSDTFLPPFSFKWNYAFCPKRRRFMHCSWKKREKGPKWCCFDGIIGLLLPLDVRSRGRRRFFFLCYRHLSLQKDADSFSKRRRPTLLAKKKLSTCWRGGSTVAAPAMSLPCFCRQK